MHLVGKAIRQGPWKLVRIGKDPWELYNMDDDPIELNNLAKKMPEKVEQLEAMWDEWFKTRKAMD